MPTTALDQQTGSASTQVADAVVELTRAELRLGLSYAKRAVKGAAATTALIWVAVWVAHLAIALICITPLLAWFRPWPMVIAAIAPAVCLSIVLGVIAFWRGKALLASRKQSTELETTGAPK